MDRGQLFELRRRTFDTPHFRGIEFIEAEAKSIINKVPGNYLPFGHTINPYRGCSHSCSYCLSGETPILMANGRTKPLADLCVGDEVYGTQRVGRYRRYVTTPVLAHWSTTKPAYRIELEDGTRLVASGDHRFLTRLRGWKHVTGAYSGPLRRPHLTMNSQLLGTGQLASPPAGDHDYRRGYLCGMIRGDGNLASYSDKRPRRAHNVQYRFRLALVDFEALKRSRDYLREFEVSTDEFLFTAAVGAHRAVHAIRTSKRDRVELIERIVCWPGTPPLEWTKGFLAGIFDAEGSYSSRVIRICNTDDQIIHQTARALRVLGFRYRVEGPRATGLKTLRVLGGVCEALRFFQTVDPAITRKRSIEGQAIKNKARLRVTSIQPLGLELPMYDITTGSGDFIANGVVSHNCFARVTHTYMDMNAGRDFESKIVVKVNAPELLRKELSAKRWQGQHIAMGTATDPYQRAEGRYRLMPGIIRALTDYLNPFSILTKGTLILRDLEFLQAAAEVTDVSTSLSIGSLDSEVWRRSESGTPHPSKRMDAVRRLNDSGIPCGVMVAPVLPGISDRPDQLMDVVKAAVDAGATHITPILLHLRPVVREEYMAWLQQTYPGLVGRYEDMYAQNAYGPKEMRKALGRRVAGLVRAAGGVRDEDKPSRRFNRSPKPEPVPAAKQLELL
jgi:DNA repair photolyase